AAPLVLGRLLEHQHGGAAGARRERGAERGIAAPDHHDVVGAVVRARHPHRPPYAKSTMSSPSAMRYHPNPTKVWVRMKRSSHLTTRKATMVETTVPSTTMLHGVCSGPGCLKSW